MAADYIPEEIMREILLRLAVKSLVRFTSVNKSWCSIIGSASFISAHHARRTIDSENDESDFLPLLVVSWTIKQEVCHGQSNTTTLVTACLGKDVLEHEPHNKAFDECTELSFTSKSFTMIEVVGSCNGLVCLRCDRNTIILWNPLIRKSMTLPKPASEYKNSSHLGLGFGFDSRTSDYRVVSIDIFTLQVFSLNTGSWKNTRSSVAKFAIDFRARRPFINGAVHWLAQSNTKNIYGHYSYWVLSFDIGNETLREIMLPIALSGEQLCISVYGKSLAVHVVRDRTRLHSSFYSIWVMKEYGVVESWTPVLNFRAPQGILREPLGFTESGGVVLRTSSGKLASYDPKSKNFKNHGVSTGKYCLVNSYVESLVLLDIPQRKIARRE